MLRLIGNHRGIHYTPDETCALCRVGRGIAPDEDETNEWKRSAQRLAKIDDMAVAAGTRRWVEKTPIHVRYLDKLFLLRPRAHVVMMVRDGRDVAASFKGRAKPERALEMVTHGAKRWVDDTEAGLLYASHKQVRELACLDVRVRRCTLSPSDIKYRLWALSRYCSSMQAYKLPCIERLLVGRSIGSSFVENYIVITNNNHPMHSLFVQKKPVLTRVFKHTLPPT